MSSKETEDFITGVAFAVLVGAGSFIIIKKLANWAETGRPATGDGFDEGFRDSIREEIETKVKRAR